MGPFVAVKAALGVLTLFIGGVVLKWTGSLLGGVASAVELRAAIAWPQVILIGGGIISLLVWAALGMPVPHFTTGTLPQIDPAFHQFAIVGGMIGGAFHFWCFVVGLKCIGEVHRFSAWRAPGRDPDTGAHCVSRVGFCRLRVRSSNTSLTDKIQMHSRDETGAARRSS